jgi:hypothetical protein
MKHSNLYLGLVLPSGGWQSLIDSFSGGGLAPEWLQLFVPQSLKIQMLSLPGWKLAVGKCHSLKVYLMLSLLGHESLGWQTLSLGTSEASPACQEPPQLPFGIETNTVA